MYKQLNSFSRKKAFGKMNVANGMHFVKRSCNFLKNNIIKNDKINNFNPQNIKNHPKMYNEQLHICCDPNFCYYGKPETTKDGKPETTKDGVKKKQKHVRNCKPGICKWCEKQNFLMTKLEKDDKLYCQEIAIEHNAFGCPKALQNGYIRVQDRNGPVILDREFLTEYILSEKSKIQKKKEAENRRLNIWKDSKYDNYCVDAIIPKDVKDTKSSTLVVEDTKDSQKLLVELKIILTTNSKEQFYESKIKVIDCNTANGSIVSETTEFDKLKKEYDELKKKEFAKLLQIFEIAGLLTPKIKKLFDDSFKILSEK